MDGQKHKYRVAEGEYLGAGIVAVMVEVEELFPDVGNRLLARLQPHFPTKAILLVCPVGERIFSYATFDSDRIAEALGDQDLDWYELDILQAPPDEELPF